MKKKKFGNNEESQVVLIFPSQTASTVDELFTAEWTKEKASGIANAERKLPIMRAVFIDSTWSQTKSIYKDQRLRGRMHIIYSKALDRVVTLPILSYLSSFLFIL